MPKDKNFQVPSYKGTSMSDMIGASAATIFYASDNDDKLVAFLNHLPVLDSNGTSQVEAKISSRWESAQIKSTGGVTLLQRRPILPGNEIAKITLSIYNFMKKRYGGNVISHRVTKKLLSANNSIGVVFEPDLIDGDERLHTFKQLTAISDGIVFDGADLLYPSLEKVDFS
jgi:hypothetical protein